MMYVRPGYFEDSISPLRNMICLLPTNSGLHSSLLITSLSMFQFMLRVGTIAVPSLVSIITYNGISQKAVFVKCWQCSMLNLELTWSALICCSYSVRSGLTAPAQ